MGASQGVGSGLTVAGTTREAGWTPVDRGGRRPPWLLNTHPRRTCRRNLHMRLVVSRAQDRSPYAYVHPAEI